MLDGEIVASSFDTLGQRIHPAASRIARLAEETPATYFAFDLLARGDKMSMAASLMYYSDRPVVWVEGPPALEQVLCSPGRVFLVVPSAEDDAWVSAMLPPGMFRLAQDGGYRVYVGTGHAGCNR